MQAIVSYRGNDSNAAVEQVVATLKHLRENPWGSRQLLESVLGIAAGLVDVNDEAAHRIYAQIKQPFAMYRLEETRRMLRYLASEKLEASESLESLADLDPNVPWKGWFLKNRARTLRKQPASAGRQGTPRPETISRTGRNGPITRGLHLV